MAKTTKSVTTKKRASKDVPLGDIVMKGESAQSVITKYVPQLGIYKIHDTVQLPKIETNGAACFDIRCHITSGETFVVFNAYNDDRSQGIPKAKQPQLPIEPHSRVLIPTGMILDIPEGYSVRLHTRSGIALKEGLNLANCEGVIDSDYTDELFVMITNNSEKRVFIKNGDRIAQGELVKNEIIEIVESDTKPIKGSNRKGGFGSTGKE